MILRTKGQATCLNKALDKVLEICVIVTSGFSPQVQKAVLLHYRELTSLPVLIVLRLSCDQLIDFLLLKHPKLTRAFLPRQRGNHLTYDQYPAIILFMEQTPNRTISKLRGSPCPSFDRLVRLVLRMLLLKESKVEIHVLAFRMAIWAHSAGVPLIGVREQTSLRT
jgi:hypothetical protein